MTKLLLPAPPNEYVRGISYPQPTIESTISTVLELKEMVELLGGLRTKAIGRAALWEELQTRYEELIRRIVTLEGDIDAELILINAEIDALWLNIATTTDVLTGTNNTKFVTPDALAALWEHGSTLTAAATLVIPAGGYFNVSGSTTITAMQFGTVAGEDKAGRRAWLRLLNAPQLNNSASIDMPGGTGHVTKANDLVLVVSKGGLTGVRVIDYFPADGAPYDDFASTTDVLTGTDTKGTVTPDALAALWEHGTAVAGATTTILGEGGYFIITGTGVSIAAITFDGKTGRTVRAVFSSAAHVLVHSANLMLPAGVNHTIVAGDIIAVTKETASAYRVEINSGNGKAIIPPTYAEVSGKPASTDNAIARFDGVLGLLQNSAAFINDTTGAIKAGNFRSTENISIADDAVATINLAALSGNTYAYVLLIDHDGGGTLGWLKMHMFASVVPSVIASAFAGSGFTQFFNTVLTGTTQTDGKLNLGVNAGTLYMENRLGAVRAFRLVFFGN